MGWIYKRKILDANVMLPKIHHDQNIVPTNLWHTVEEQMGYLPGDDDVLVTTLTDYAEDYKDSVLERIFYVLNKN